jgi:hypothetical protein
MPKSGLSAFLIKELREVLLPTVFFAVGFNLTMPHTTSLAAWPTLARRITTRRSATLRRPSYWNPITPEPTITGELLILNWAKMLRRRPILTKRSSSATPRRSNLRGWTSGAWSYLSYQITCIGGCGNHSGGKGD